MTVALQHQGYSTKALLLHTVHSFVHSFRHWLLHEPLYEKGGLFSLSLGCRPLGFNKIILRAWKQWSATEMWLSCDGVLVMAILSLLGLLTPVIRWRSIPLVPELWPMVEACLNMLEDTWSWRADTTTGSREVPAKPPQDWCLCACAYGFNLSSYLHLRHLAWAEKGKHDFSCACGFTTLCRCCGLPALTLALTLILSLSSTPQSQSISWQLDFSLLPVSFSTSAPVSMTTYLSFEKMDKRCIEKEN